ncbi:family 20 glycosylhydrolase [Trueperella pyogenes]|uniref:family 20 glycosylhydrolase n=1 Tax=Trueperella pyogenes TaxID=1661 RepID=UPI00345D9470
MRNVRYSLKRRMVAVASATLVMLVGGGIGALSAPIAAADTVTDKYIGGPNQLYVGHADSIEKSGEPNGNGPAEKAIDGKAETYWHTNWSVGGETAGPHWISVGTFPNETIKSCTFTGLEYTQRQGSAGEGKKNGIVGNYEIHVSDSAIKTAEGFTETTKVASGTFADQDAPQIVKFDQNKAGKFVTLKALNALSASKSQAVTAVGDLRLIGSCKTEAGQTIVTPAAPVQSEDSTSITIPAIDGVDYKIGDRVVTGKVELAEGSTTVVATPKDSFKFYGEQAVKYAFEFRTDSRPAAPTAGLPATIPALTSDFKAAEGSWTATQSITVVRPEKFAASAQLLVDELNAYTKGTAIKGATAGTGIEIVLDENQKADLGAEGYTLTIAESGVKITAAAQRGAFWGTRTLSQMLRQNLTLPAGSVTDKPAYAERGVTLCACQINFSTEWIDRFLNEMADLKLNSVLMEMKLKSDKFPVANTFSYYSRDDVKKFVKKAEAYGIDVIPEINSPGHMNIWLENLPDFQLKNQSGKGNADRLDITNPEAVKFYKTLIDEYDGVFSTKYWHMGADEYMIASSYSNYPQLAQYAQKVTKNNSATGADAFTYFINDINSYVKTKGKTLRIWNDGIVSTRAVTLDKDIVVEHWLGSGRSPNELANDGYKLVNANLDLYFARLSPYPIQKNGPAFLYDNPNFGVDVFQGRSTYYPIKVDKKENILGAKLSIWPDNGVKQTENEVEADVYEAMRYVAQITWGGGNPADNPTYADFKEKRVDKVKRSPMWNNINRKPLEDGVYTIAQPDGKDLQLSGKAGLGGNDEWTLTSTPDHYYQLKNMTSNECLSVVSGYKHLSTVTQVGARPEARPCVDVSQTFTGNQTGNVGYEERNPQKWMLLDAGDGKFKVVNAVTLQRLAVAKGTEDHIDFTTFNGVAKDTKPAAGEIVQFPGDMTDDVWTIKPSTRSISAIAEATPKQAYASKDGSGASTIDVTVANNSKEKVSNVVVTPPVKRGWHIDKEPKTIAHIAPGESAKVSFQVSPEWYRGDAQFEFTVTAGDEVTKASAKVKAICGKAISPKVVGTDSEELVGETRPNGTKEAAADGKIATFWHTKWKNAHNTKYPHRLDFQIGDEPTDVCGVVYTARQDSGNGRVKDYQLYVSDEPFTDDVKSGKLVKEGTFANDTAAQNVDLSNARGKYLRLVGLNAHDGKEHMTVAEFQVINGTGAPKTLVEPTEPAYEGNTYTIPAIDGVIYKVDGEKTEPGKHKTTPGATITVTAEPAEAFYFADSFYDNKGEFIPWKHTFAKVVSPEEPAWDDEHMTFTVPDSEYFDYLLGSTRLTPGVQSVEPNYLAVVSAQLKDGLTDSIQVEKGATTSWTHQFPNKAVEPTPRPDPKPEPQPGSGPQPGPTPDPAVPGAGEVLPLVPGVVAPGVLGEDSVVAEKPAPRKGVLSHTGVDVVGLFGAGVMLVLAGVVVTRRRRG